jgi:hypothetical protein
MLDREQKGDAVGRGHLHLHPAWLQLLTPEGHLIYVNPTDRLVSLQFITAPVGGTCGGESPSSGLSTTTHVRWSQWRLLQGLGDVTFVFNVC